LSEPEQPQSSQPPAPPPEGRSAPGAGPTSSAKASEVSVADGRRGPTVEVVIQPGRGGLAGVLGECWQYRELLYFLAWRDVKVRYKQTVLGAAWAVLQPLVNMVIFTVLFNQIGRIGPADWKQYAILTFAGLLPWMLFQSSLVQSSGSIVSSANLLTKVYFPRLLSPLAAVVSALLDFAISMVILVGMMVAAGVRVHWGVLALPLFVLMAVAAALSVGVWLAALNAKYRDVRYAVPFMAQAWMFLSPVAYPAEKMIGFLKSVGIPEWVYPLNPMVGVVEGFRWSILGGEGPAPAALAISGGVTVVLLLGGLLYFRGVERTFADVV
jgi:lipopolysaccharide transport system permease protein